LALALGLRDQLVVILRIDLSGPDLDRSASSARRFAVAFP
jgi:hypothetical protein